MTNPMSLAFLVSALALALLVGLALVWPLLRAGREQGASLLALNVQVFEERLRELEQDHAEQRIDADTFTALKTELQRQLLSLETAASPAATRRASRGQLLGLFLLVPVLAGLTYAGLAYQPALTQWWQALHDSGPVVDELLAGRQPEADVLQKQNLANFARVLQQRLQQNPAHADGWLMLAMAFIQGELPDQALVALGHAYQLAPERDDIALAYAQTLVFSQQGKLSPLSRELLMQVLNRHPDHEGALLLMGMGAYRSGDYAGALTFLPKLRAAHLSRTGDTNSEAIREIDQAIALAKAGGEQGAPTGTGITVTVTLARELQVKVPSGATLFVFARALNGPPMPLAVVRQPVGAFPLTVELNDRQSMMPGMVLSKFPSVVVNARISASGQPQGAAGDLEAVAVPVTQRAGQPQRVELLINQIKP